ncbi:hypothetical protein N7448_010984 [Penicillium atrosanguineum]|nr:hypothetical protein N7448_010984 [Penicillium atrosanguineum]
MAFSQASYFTDRLSEADFLQSDDLPILTSTRGTVTSIAPSENHLPSHPTLAPSSLQRVGPRLQQSWVIYDTEADMDHSRTTFVEWWLLTDFGSKKDTQESINWSGRKKSSLWDNFSQVVHQKTGEPKIICQRCNTLLVHPHFRRGGTSPMRTHLKGGTCRPSLPKRGIDQLMQSSPQPVSNRGFSQEVLSQKLLQLISIARLPFRILERPELQELCDVIQLASSKIKLPSPRSIRRQLDEDITQGQRRVLDRLPVGSQISIALDCWTSPFSQAFMAITGYFLDQDWEYREVLLGFEPLHGSHTGSNLSTTVIEILQKHSIADRVLSVTTNNATNNNTMMSSIQDEIRTQGIGNANVFRVPCLAHVIQLSLNQLLGKMKAAPVNNEAEVDWSDERAHSLHSRRSKREIVDTLNKVRNLAIFVNASPQRREAFLSLQTEEPRLIPIQDVRTRWNSTFLMLGHAKRLQSTFNLYCTTHEYPQFQLDKEEWRQIEYLLCITEPFFKFTTALSKSKDITVHLIFGVYNKLFTHLEASEKQLVRKKLPWKQAMLQALQAARKKLSEYYTATDDEAYGDMYAIATILAPSKKLRFFTTRDWRGEIDYVQRYRDCLEKEFWRYKQRFAESNVPTASKGLIDPLGADDSIEMLVDSQVSLQQDETLDDDDELARYLAKELSGKNISMSFQCLQHWPVTFSLFLQVVLALNVSSIVLVTSVIIGEGN